MTMTAVRNCGDGSLPAAAVPLPLALVGAQPRLGRPRGGLRHVPHGPCVGLHPLRGHVGRMLHGGVLEVAQDVLGRLPGKAEQVLQVCLGSGVGREDGGLGQDQLGRGGEEGGVGQRGGGRGRGRGGGGPQHGYGGGVRVVLQQVSRVDPEACVARELNDGPGAVAPPDGLGGLVALLLLLLLQRPPVRLRRSAQPPPRPVPRAPVFVP